MLKVKNMVSTRSGRTVVNQFDISRTDEAGVIGEYAFQSYDSLCASLKRTESGLYKLTIYRDGFYSRTTAKYLRAWLFTYLPADCVPEIIKVAKMAISDGDESWTTEGWL